MTEMEYIHLIRRQFPTPAYWLFILYAAPSQKMRARVARDGTICAKNSTFGYFDGTNPITGKGIQLWSFLPRFAPEATLRCLLSHSGDLNLISRGQNS